MPSGKDTASGPFRDSAFRRSWILCRWRVWTQQEKTPSIQSPSNGIQSANNTQYTVYAAELLTQWQVYDTLPTSRFDPNNVMQP